MYDKQSPFSVKTQPGRQSSLADAAHSTVQSAIIDCALPPGSVVSEAELASRFAFGLASVRAALMRLTEAGWIASDGRRGSMVLPVSASHLADLQLSRQCLEPALTLHAPPTELRNELRLRATIYRVATGHDQTVVARALLHQERAMLSLISQSVAALRLRNWLNDTWDLCLRADRHLDQAFGIARAPLPLAELATALADNDGPAACQILEQMRHDFDQRITRALSRSTAALMPAATASVSAPAATNRSARSAPNSRLRKSPGARSPKGTSP